VLSFYSAQIGVSDASPLELVDAPVVLGLGEHGLDHACLR
jgi:hypothetical protein